ncbi:hypothetical protein G0P98_27600 [Yangia sp. PrR004]|nr:hypothetical protein [Salipiger sp. PrR004]
MTVELDIKPDTKTVAHLKTQLSEVINLQPDRLYIGFETSLLDDQDYLAKHSISDSDTVHVITS